MLAVRTLTAAALLAVFLAAVLFLDRVYLAVVAGAVVASGAYEWALLVRTRGGNAILYAIVCTAVYAAIAALAWHRSWIGAVAFMVLAIAYALWAGARLDWVVAISGPLMGVGLLFLFSWRSSSTTKA